MMMRLIALMFGVVALTSLPETNAFAAKADTTGQCVCKKGANVLATYSATMCVPKTHDGCTSAKQACVTQNQAACTALGGILTQSGKSCTVGSRC